MGWLLGSTSSSFLIRLAEAFLPQHAKHEAGCRSKRFLS